ncbi:MAG: hypothetical protein VB080_07105 [Propionicimonas sp.]|uniref:hypothetical protein n=1 Tax=Propionicimonas sp. TaxID=1955623 RepID=UPI002B206398|nr:hypothetical protein [Propionicimonas sp.]MEA4944191.1 hypothetical protein [Propionicimonas sp.]
MWHELGAVTLDVESEDWAAACARLPWLEGAAEALLAVVGPLAVAQLFDEYGVPFRLTLLDGPCGCEA